MRDHVHLGDRSSVCVTEPAKKSSECGSQCFDSGSVGSWARDGAVIEENTLKLPGLKHLVGIAKRTGKTAAVAGGLITRSERRPADSGLSGSGTQRV